MLNSIFISLADSNFMDLCQIELILGSKFGVIIRKNNKSQNVDIVNVVTLHEKILNHITKRVQICPVVLCSFVFSRTDLGPTSCFSRLRLRQQIIVEKYAVRDSRTTTALRRCPSRTFSAFSRVYSCAFSSGRHNRLRNRVH